LRDIARKVAGVKLEDVHKTTFMSRYVCSDMVWSD